MNMELKQVQIAIDVSNLHGNRTFPSTLTAWMVVLDTTLGARQTFYKAPRNSDRPLADDNVFTKNDFWNLISCKPSQPLALSNLTSVWMCLFVSLFLCLLVGWLVHLLVVCLLVRLLFCLLSHLARWLRDTREWHFLQPWAGQIFDSSFSQSSKCWLIVDFVVLFSL